MKKTEIIIEPNLLIIVALATALYNHVDALLAKAVCFAIIFMASAQFVFILISGLTRKKIERDIKVIDSRSIDIPPEIREEMRQVEEKLRKHLESQVGGPIEKFGDAVVTQERCNDPHCKNCHPELNED